MSLWGNVGSLVIVGNTATNTTLFGLSSTASLRVGMGVTGNNVGVGNTITSIVNSTAVGISSAAGGTSNGSYTFSFPPKWKHTVTADHNKANGIVGQGNVTQGAFGLNEAIGVFPANTLQVHQSNGGGSNPNAPSGGDRVTSPGWIAVRQFCGPVTSITVGNASLTGVANLASYQAQNATSNSIPAAIHVVSTNSTGGAPVLSIDSGGSFVNSSVVAFIGGANSMLQANIATPGAGYSTQDTVLFSNGLINAVAHPGVNSMGAITSLTFVVGGAGFLSNSTVNNVVVSIQSAGANGISSATVTPGTSLSFTNGDIAVFSMANPWSGNPAKFTLGTNATGGITSANCSVCGSGFTGNAASVLTSFTNSTGGATAGVIGTGSVTANAFNGINAVIAANSTSVTGTSAGNAALSVATMGGRAGRVHYETLVEISSISNPNGPSFPNS